MLLRAIARPMIAAGFIADGLHAARRPQEHLLTARAGLTRATDLTDKLPLPDAAAQFTPGLSDQDLAKAIRVHGIATIVAGTCLALGKAPRLAGLTLTALTAPLVIANEPFSKQPGRERRIRRTEFVRKLGALGAALLVAADTAGEPSLRWRASNALHQQKKQQRKEK